MRRLFLSLYVALAVAFLVSVLGVPWLLNASLRGSLMSYGERLAAAPQYLFEQELGALPPDQWQSRIADLQSRFGYGIELVDIESLDVSPGVMQRLRAGFAVTNDEDKARPDTMLLPVRGSSFVVRTAFSESDTDKAERSLGGIYYLVEKQIAGVPEQERPALLATLSARFGIPLTLLAEPGLELTVEQQRQMDGHRVVGFNMTGRGDELYYKRLADDTALLQIGPLPVPGVLRLATPIAYAAFATVLGIIAFLWIRPLWADIRRLDQRAAEFGRGDLGARVEVGAGSSIRPLAATFNSMANQIQSFIATQRELNDAVSHELRTPLARLRFGLDMMAAAASDEDRHRYARGMAADIGELEALVDESLTYARLTSASGVQLHAGPVELRSWVDEIMAATAIRPGENSPEVEISSVHGSAVFDRRLMARAVQNLVRNALQFAASRVRIVIADTGEGLQIEVHDDGPGVPVDERTAIFLPYHRVDDSRSRESGGYGLGLAIVKRVCDLHHAAVTVDASPLGGALFRILIPA